MNCGVGVKMFVVLGEKLVYSLCRWIGPPRHNNPPSPKTIADKIKTSMVPLC